MLRWGIVLLLVSNFGSAALADQKDARLDGLFKTLREATDPPSAIAAQARIWNIWSTSKDAETNRLMRHGVAAMRARDNGRALAAFHQIVVHEPDFAEGWNKRATVHYMLGDFAASIEDIKRTLALESRHFGALAGLGMIYDAIGEKEGALKAYQRAFRINPHLPMVRQRIDTLGTELKGRPI
jgi:tetratricopeptide (TPR) repeat protein